MYKLNSLHQVARLDLTPEHIKHLVNQLGTLGVVALGELRVRATKSVGFNREWQSGAGRGGAYVVAGARLAEDKVGRPEEVTELEITN